MEILYKLLNATILENPISLGDFFFSNSLYVNKNIDVCPVCDPVTNIVGLVVRPMSLKG